MARRKKSESKPTPPQHTTLASIVRKPVSWRIDNWLPIGMLTGLTGPAGSGKSTFASMLVSQACGGPMFFPSKRPGRVRAAWFSTEESLDSLVANRLFGVSCPPDMLLLPEHNPSGEWQTPLRLPKHLLRLERFVKETGCHVLVFDPAQSFLDGDLSPNNSSDVRSMLEQLMKLAERYEMSVILIMHPRKDKTGGQLDWIAGSSAWPDCCRVIWQCGLHPDQTGQRVLFPAKFTVGPPPSASIFDVVTDKDSISFASVGQTNLTASDILSSSTERSVLEERQTGTEWLKRVLEGGRKEVGNLYKAWQSAGYGRNAWWKARTTLGVKYYKEGDIESVTTFLYIPGTCGDPAVDSQIHPSQDTPTVSDREYSGTQPPERRDQ